jgi:hypothetical protein
LIGARLGCDCRFTRAVPVQKAYKERVLWDGKVGVFKLAGADRACYAWTGDALMGDMGPVIIVESETITSPAEAVEWYLQGLCETTGALDVQHAA